MAKILVDTENSVTLRDWSKLPSQGTIILFLSDRIPSVNPLVRQLGNNWKIEVIYVYASLKNAMDNAICEYIWKDSIAGNGQEYIIISSDHDFDHEIKEFKKQGVNVRRDALEPESEGDSWLFDDFPGTCPVNADVISQLTDKAATKQMQDNISSSTADPRPLRTLGKQKRKECRQYLISLGFLNAQAKTVCRAMSPDMADMIMSGIYPDKESFEKVSDRIYSRLEKLGLNDDEINRLAGLVIKRATVKRETIKGRRGIRLENGKN